MRRSAAGFQIEGRWVHAEVTGSAGPVVTLLHGGLVDSGSWGELVPGLASWARVVTFDIAGYGASDPAPGRDPISGAAEDCLEIWAHLGVDRSWVLGFSQGGFAALRLAARAPGRVDGLVLVSTAASLDETGRRAMADRAARLRRDGIAQDVEAHLHRAFSPDFVAANPTVMSRYSSMVTEADPEVVADTLEALAAADEFAGLDAVSVPTLVVLGEHDRAFAEMGAKTAAAIPGARLVTLPGTGHTIHVEQPLALLDLVSDLIRGHDPSVAVAPAPTNTD